jgi:hypothetical protein
MWRAEVGFYVAKAVAMNLPHVTRADKPRPIVRVALILAILVVLRAIIIAVLIAAYSAFA